MSSSNGWMADSIPAASDVVAYYSEIEKAADPDVALALTREAIRRGVIPITTATKTDAPAKYDEINLHPWVKEVVQRLRGRELNTDEAAYLTEFVRIAHRR